MQYASPAPAGDAPQRERLPSFLMSSSNTAPAMATTPGPTGFPYTPGRAQTVDPPTADGGSGINWPFQQRRPTGTSIAFNDRLRTDRHSGGPIETPAREPSLENPSIPATDSHRTPSRMPPNKSLLDSGPPSVLHLRTPSASPAVQSATPGSFARNTPRHSSPGMTPTTANGHAQEVSRWITVFGFPREMESQTLREFRRHGDIVRTVPGKGNWVHLLYRTPLQSQVALYKPWRVLAGTDVMVGAVPCTEPSVAKDVDDNVDRGILVASPSANGTSTPRDQPELRAMTSPSQAGSGLPTPSSVLRRDYGQSASATQSIVRTPQRQTGILDYITGFYK